MPLQLVNRSGYDSADLHRFFSRGLRAHGIDPSTVEISVFASPIRSRGCAEIGGRRVSIAIASPSNFSLRRLVRLCDHEFKHLRGCKDRRGCDHAEMSERDLYSLGKTSAWGRGQILRHKRRAPPQIRLMGSAGRDRVTRGDPSRPRSRSRSRRRRRLI